MAKRDAGKSGSDNGQRGKLVRRPAETAEAEFERHRAADEKRGFTFGQIVDMWAK